MRILKCCVRISPRILTTDPHPHAPHRFPAAAVCPVHLSLASWVTEEQLTAAAVEHGHGVTQIEHVRQHYTIASAHCAQQVSWPSAELELMIHVSPRPRIFGGKPSASVRGSQEFLRICVRRWMHLPSAHLCHRPPWPLAWCGESHASIAIINAMTVIWCCRRTCHHTHVTREVTTAAQDAAVADDHDRWSSGLALQRTQQATDVTRNWSCRGRLFGYFRWQMTVVEIIIAELHCLSNGGHRVDCSVSYVRDGLTKDKENA